MQTFWETILQYAPSCLNYLSFHLGILLLRIYYKEIIINIEKALGTLEFVMGVIIYNGEEMKMSNYVVADFMYRDIKTS